MTKNIPTLPNPTPSLVEEHLGQWETLEKYRLQEASLKLLFGELCAGHEDVSHVLLKVSVLNDFYSTNIYDTHVVARHILNIGVGKRIIQGDPRVVNEIALVPIGEKKRNFYSFASKYCNHHNAESFPIYDSYVEKMLLHFQRKDGFAIFKKLDLKQYESFVDIIKAFREHYRLTRFSLRQIDIYLWLGGKDAFSST